MSNQTNETIGININHPVDENVKNYKKNSNEYDSVRCLLAHLLTYSHIYLIICLVRIVQLVFIGIVILLTIASIVLVSYWSTESSALWIGINYFLTHLLTH